MNEYTFRVGKVENIDDKNGMGRVKVKLEGDPYTTDSERPWSIPLMPKHFYILPQVGETVLLFTPILNKFDKTTNTFWLGPIASQLNKLDKTDQPATNPILLDSIVSANENPELYVTAKGLYPNTNDTGLLGKNNTDVLLKDSEVWVRAGKYETGEDNKKVFSYNPTFLQLKSTPRSYNNQNEQNIDYKTTATLVAENINLISSSKVAKRNFNVTDPDSMIKDTDMQEILEKASRLPYGDILVDFLRLLINAFVTHSHPYPGMSPLQTNEVKEMTSFNLEDILSNNIRIN